MPVTSAVAARGVSKRFGATVAIGGVDLTVAPGEIRGLLGPNGAGKTTLLRMLLGLVAPDDGAIELFGRPFHAPATVGSHGVAGFVEMPCFYPYLGGRANLEVLAQLDRGGSAGRIGEALARVGLGARADDRVSGYSTGMRQRLGIAAALISAPRVLLLDEPTSGLDPVSAREVAGLLRSLASQGVAVVFSSHQIGEVEELCDTFTFLRRGEVVWDGGARELDEQTPPSAFSLQTSDDQRAVGLARRHPDAEVTWGRDGRVSVTATQADMDRFVLELARAGVSVRRLELVAGPLQSMFFRLTDQPQPVEHAGSAVSALSGSL